jgi:diguanylate cyclase (GGDEF)-like protein
MRSLIPAWRASPETNLRLTIALGGLLLWLLVEYFIVSDALRGGTQAHQALAANARQATAAKAREMSQVLNDIYVGTRTIALLPSVRSAPAQNRTTDSDDVVDGKRFTVNDAQTVAQLYFHLADVLSVSEVYVVYDGFAPQRGEVPFLMFDSVIVDRFRQLSGTGPGHGDAAAAPDSPPQIEAEEYAALTGQLQLLRRDHPQLPINAPQGVASLVSPPLVTCDNSQFTSIRQSHPADRLGMLFSVPIYDAGSGAFKGLVSTIVRLNALEARLVDWPLIPVTTAEQDYIKRLRLDNTPASEYVLENQLTGARIADRRHAGVAAIVAGREAAGLSVKVALDGAAGNPWVLYRHVPHASFDAIDAATRHTIRVQSAVAAVVLLVLAGIALLFASQRRNAALLKEMADYDPLTGLPNRRQLDRVIDTALQHAAATPHRLAVVMVDLDNFKAVNDTLGHPIGDQLLIEVARRFQKQIHAMDPRLAANPDDTKAMAPLIGRLGGDEFLIVLPVITDEAAVATFTETLLTALAVPMFLEGHSLQVRASMGVALYPEHGASAAQLLRSADQAMYAAKRVDDSAVVVFEREVDHSAMRRLRLTGDLRDALVQQQFELHFQNVVNLQRRRVDCAEALLRWRHPELGMVSPAEFVPLLERSGLIVPVGLWALRHACDQLRAWQASGALIEAVSVNVSVVQLAQSDFSSDALAVLAASGVDPACVTIEVTESVLMDNPERSIAQLQTLRDAGLRIAIDDFGAGYSSLAYLRRLPVQVMKIDRALLIDAVHPTGRAILSAMVDLAAELGLDCIAEGVETLEQYGLLFDIGCHRLQGYLFARPMPAAEAEAAARRLDLANVMATGGMFSESGFGRIERRSGFAALGA